MNTRRSFFQNIALLSALGALAEEEGFAQPQDDKVANFWDAYFDEATRDPTHVSRGSNDANLIDPSKRVQLIHATDSGLIYPDGIDDKQLPAESDVVVTVNPNHFRPAPNDQKAISRSRGCQIRLDCIQTTPIMNLIAPMAWSGLAAWSVEKQTYGTSSTVDPKTMKSTSHLKVNAGPAPPSLKDLDFRDPNDPSAPVHNQVILMGGSGRMALNVRGVSANSRLQSVLDKSVQYSSIVAPFFGFAPIAIPALRAFTTLLGAVFNHEAVIMNSMPLQVLATQDAKKNPHDSSSVKIVSGDFIAVPINQTATLKGAMDKLRVVEGWLVHQDSSKDVPPEQRAADPRIPEISYLTMSFTVQSLADAQKQKAKG
jgi:hypothetical protein